MKFMQAIAMNVSFGILFLVVFVSTDSPIDL
jgi:hypothetical protein